MKSVLMGVFGALEAADGSLLGDLQEGAGSEAP